MCRFTDWIVSGFVIAWRFATSPTCLSPFLKETTDGVVRFPSGFGITTDSPPSITDTHEFVVPKSIPIILLIFHFLLHILTIIIYLLLPLLAGLPGLLADSLFAVLPQ